VIGRDAVLERVRAAGVLRDIATDRARLLRRRVGSVEKAVLAHGVGDVEINDTAFDLDAAALEIDRDNPVHPRSADHHGRPHRQRAAGEPGTGAARNERDLSPPQRAQNFAHLFGRAGQHEHVGCAFLDRPAVALVNLELRRARHDSVIAGDSPQLRDERGLGRMIAACVHSEHSSTRPPDRGISRRARGGQ
jgi:hypothetical protein